MKLVKCKACSADIAKSAKRCPQCGAKQIRVSGILSSVAIVIIALVIISTVFSDDKSSPEKVNPSTPAFASSAPASALPSSTRFAVGDKVSLNDVDVTFVGYEEHDGSQFNEPSDGNVFVLCEFLVENNSSSDITVSTLISFETYVDDFSTNLSLGAMIGTDKKQLDGSVAAGKKISGVVGYEIPRDWMELEIRYSPSFWSSKDITFVATK